jgi:hypothetical protein
VYVPGKLFKSVLTTLFLITKIHKLRTKMFYNMEPLRGQKIRRWWVRPGNTKGGSITVPLTSWLVWNQLYDNWQLWFLFSKQANPKQLNRRSTVRWYFPFSNPWSDFPLQLISPVDWQKYRFENVNFIKTFYTCKISKTQKWTELC